MSGFSQKPPEPMRKIACGPPVNGEPDAISVPSGVDFESLDARATALEGVSIPEFSAQGAELVTENWSQMRTSLSVDSSAEVDAKIAQVAGFSGDYGDLTNVPSTFSPSAHDHDTRYYTEAEVDALLAALPGGSGPEYQVGVVNLTAGGSSNVVFSPAFSQAPRVFVTAQFNNADTSCTYSAHTITANGFTMRGAGNPAGNVAWLAIL